MVGCKRKRPDDETPTSASNPTNSGAASNLGGKRKRDDEPDGSLDPAYVAGACSMFHIVFSINVLPD